MSQLFRALSETNNSIAVSPRTPTRLTPTRSANENSLLRSIFKTPKSQMIKKDEQRMVLSLGRPKGLFMRPANRDHFKTPPAATFRFKSQKRLYETRSCDAKLETSAPEKQSTSAADDHLPDIENLHYDFKPHLDQPNYRNMDVEMTFDYFEEDEEDTGYDTDPLEFIPDYIDFVELPYTIEGGLIDPIALPELPEIEDIGDDSFEEVQC